jgi:hypothetical protein
VEAGGSGKACFAFAPLRVKGDGNHSKAEAVSKGGHRERSKRPGG